MAKGARIVRVFDVDKVVHLVFVGGHPHRCDHLGDASVGRDAKHRLDVRIEHLVATRPKCFLMVDKARAIVDLEHAFSVCAAVALQRAGDVNYLVILVIELLLEVKIGVGRGVHRRRQYRGVRAFALQIAEAPGSGPVAGGRFQRKAQSLEHPLADERLVFGEIQRLGKVGVRLEHQVDVCLLTGGVFLDKVVSQAIVVKVHVQVKGGVDYGVVFRRRKRHDVVKDGAQVKALVSLPDVGIVHAGGLRPGWYGDDAGTQVLVVRDWIAAQVCPHRPAGGVEDDSRGRDGIAGKRDRPAEHLAAVEAVAHRRFLVIVAGQRAVIPDHDYRRQEQVAAGGEGDIAGVGHGNSDGVCQAGRGGIRPGDGVYLAAGGGPVVNVVDRAGGGLRGVDAGQQIVGVVVEKELVKGPQRLVGAGHGRRVGEHTGDEALVVHVDDGAEQCHHVGDDDPLGVGLFFVLQRQRQVKVVAPGRQRIEAIQLNVPVADEAGGHAGLHVQRVAADVLRCVVVKGIHVGRLGGADQCTARGQGIGFRVGGVDQRRVARRGVTQLPDDGRRAIRILGETIRCGRDCRQRGGKAIVQRVGDHHVLQRAVPVVFEGGRDGHLDAGLVGRDDRRADGGRVLLGQAAVNPGPLGHGHEHRVQHLRIVVLQVRWVRVHQHHLAVAGVGVEDGRRAWLRRFGSSKAGDGGRAGHGRQ